MILINDIKVPNLITEMTIGQYEILTALLNNKNLDQVSKYIKIFESFGVTSTYLNTLNLDEFGQLIKDFNVDSEVPKELVRVIELNGFTYEAYPDGETFDIKVKDMRHVGKCFKMDKYIASFMALIFKRTDLTDIEHYSGCTENKFGSHIIQKTKLFRQLPASLCVPYIVYLGEKFNSIYDNKTKELEANNNQTIS